MGPLEVVAIEFAGSRFKGEAMHALTSAVEHGTIRIIDLTFLSKDASGVVASYELAELDEGESAPFDLVEMTTGVLSVADIDKIGAMLAADTCAALMVIEHAWAADLEQAVVGAKGRLLASQRVPAEIARRALADADVAPPA